MHSLLTSLTILVLAGIAQAEVDDRLSGWDPFAALTASAPGE